MKADNSATKTAEKMAVHWDARSVVLTAARMAERTETELVVS